MVPEAVPFRLGAVRTDARMDDTRIEPAVNVVMPGVRICFNGAGASDGRLNNNSHNKSATGFS
jgi:hypothetical protein